jgi:hypothetical protein
MQYSRTFGTHVTASTGYQVGIHTFRDGIPAAVSSGITDFCKPTPPDPRCVVSPVVTGQPRAGEQGSTLHRVHAGYAYDPPAGLQLDVDAGYDLLVPGANAFGSISKPFLRSSLGWSATRFLTQVGYEQGLDEGGGVMGNAEIRRGRTNAHIRFTDRASLDLSLSRDVRRSLDDAGITSRATLTSLRAGSSFTYTLSLGWALIALFTVEEQTSRGMSAVPDEVRANRYAVGASWTISP